MPQLRYHLGDQVTFRLGSRYLKGRVKEDRGPIGIGGRHLYLVEFHSEVGYPSHVELPADQLEHEAGRNSKAVR